MSLAAYFHPQAFYVLPLLLLERGSCDGCDRCDGLMEQDDICITLGWFVWTLEVWL